MDPVLIEVFVITLVNSSLAILELSVVQRFVYEPIQKA